MTSSDLTGIEGQCEPARLGARSELWRQNRIPLLLAIFALCCLIFVRVVPRDRQLHLAMLSVFGRVPGSVEEEQLRLIRAQDPPLGTRLRVPGRLGSLGVGAPVTNRGVSQSPSAQPSILVLMMGRCSECVLPALQAAQELRYKTTDVRVIAVSPSSRSELKVFGLRHRLQLELVTEAGLDKIYNVAWTPRAYLLSSEGVLLWAQQQRHFRAEDVVSALRRSREGSA